MVDHSSELSRLVDELNRSTTGTKTATKSGEQTSLDQVLTLAGQRHASDVILVAGSPIALRVNGALMLYPQEIRNYRDWTKIDVDLWRHYWFAMVNRGVLAQPYWWDEQWTISVQHTDADIDKHLAAFEEVAPSLAKAQAERGMVTAAAGH